MFRMEVASACEEVREHLSARLDGEEPAAGLAAEVADQHLAGCPGCSAWWDRAVALARLTRTAAALPGPALSDDAMAAILAESAASAERPAHTPVVMRLLRLALGAVGLAQFLLGFAQISSLAATAGDHVHDPEIGAASSGHLWHESAAWNVAVGAALAWLAWRRTRPASLLPVMTAFVAVLTLLTVNDALTGRVEASRILSHGFVLTGYFLLLVMNMRRFRDLEPPAEHRRPPLPWTPGGRGTGDDDGPLATVHPLPVRLSHPRQVTATTRRAA
jgi:predicted anti-sigma-YlaC factor YlaD